MRMSRHEVLDEFKQSDGDPHTKQRLRGTPARAGAAPDDRRRAASDGGDHQPDPLRRGAALRRRRDRRARRCWPRASTRWRSRSADRRRERHSGDREPSARPRSACRLRPRRRHPARALPGGGRGHLLRAAPGRAVADRAAVPGMAAGRSGRARAKFSFTTPPHPRLHATPRAGRGRPSMERGTVAQARSRHHCWLGHRGPRRRPRPWPRPPGLFGTAEFRTDCLAALPQWQRRPAADRGRGAPIRACAEDAGPLPEPRHHGLAGAAARPGGRAGAEQLAAVNRFVNQWPYRTDADNYGRSDYWATPLEFFRRSGDCEDYVIAKYRSLRRSAAGRAAADGRGAGRGPRPAARGAGGLSGR